MISIDPNTKTARENYKILTGSVIPRPIAFVTTMSASGVLNAAPFSYFNIVSSNPPLLSVSIERSNGKMKDTARNIMFQNEYVIHIVDEDLVHNMNKTAASLPPDKSEVDLTTLTKEASTCISVPAIKEAKIRFECILEQTLQVGDKDFPSCDLMIGRIVQYHIKNDVYYNGKIDPAGLSAVSRLAGNNYANVGEIYEIKRPK